MICPKCGRPVAENAVICSGCDFILDTQFLGDGILDEDHSLRPGMGGISASTFNLADALILGDLDESMAQNLDAADLGFANPDSSSGSSGMRLYISGRSQAMLAPDAIPALSDGIDPATVANNAKLTPFEKHILNFIDGHRPVELLLHHTGLEEAELKTALATLADKGIIRVVGRMYGDFDAMGDTPTKHKKNPRRRLRDSGFAPLLADEAEQAIDDAFRTQITQIKALPSFLGANNPQQTANSMQNPNDGDVFARLGDVGSFAEATGSLLFDALPSDADSVLSPHQTYEFSRRNFAKSPSLGATAPQPVSPATPPTETASPSGFLGESLRQLAAAGAPSALAGGMPTVSIPMVTIDASASDNGSDISTALLPKNNQRRLGALDPQPTPQHAQPYAFAASALASAAHEDPIAELSGHFAAHKPTATAALYHEAESVGFTGRSIAAEDSDPVFGASFSSSLSANAHSHSAGVLDDPPLIVGKHEPADEGNTLNLAPVDDSTELLSERQPAPPVVIGALASTPAAAPYAASAPNFDAYFTGNAGYTPELQPLSAQHTVAASYTELLQQAGQNNGTGTNLLSGQQTGHFPNPVGKDDLDADLLFIQPSETAQFPHNAQSESLLAGRTSHLPQPATSAFLGHHHDDKNDKNAHDDSDFSAFTQTPSTSALGNPIRPSMNPAATEPLLPKTNPVAPPRSTGLMPTEPLLPAVSLPLRRQTPSPMPTVNPLGMQQPHAQPLTPTAIIPPPRTPALSMTMPVVASPAGAMGGGGVNGMMPPMPPPMTQSISEAYDVGSLVSGFASAKHMASEELLSRDMEVMAMTAPLPAAPAGRAVAAMPEIPAHVLEEVIPGLAPPMGMRPAASSYGAPHGTPHNHLPQTGVATGVLTGVNTGVQTGIISGISTGLSTGFPSSPQPIEASDAWAASGNPLNQSIGTAASPPNLAMGFGVNMGSAPSGNGFSDDMSAVNPVASAGEAIRPALRPVPLAAAARIARSPRASGPVAGPVAGAVAGSMAGSMAGAGNVAANAAMPATPMRPSALVADAPIDIAPAPAIKPYAPVAKNRPAALQVMDASNGMTAAQPHARGNSGPSNPFSTGFEPSTSNSVSSVSPAQAMPSPAAAGRQPSGEMLYKARQLFQEAQRDAQDNRMGSARMNLKLALLYDPHNPEYQAAMQAWSNPTTNAAHAKPNATEERPPEVVLYEQAQERESMGDIDGAMLLLQQGLAINPNVAAIHNRLGVLIALQKKDYQSAAHSVQRAVELDPNNMNYKSNLGKIMSRLQTNASA